MREEVIEVVSVYDPAIDVERVTWDEIRKYISERPKNWRSALKFKPGQQPTVYKLKEISRALWFGYVRTAPSDALAAMRAFQCSVVGVQNLRTVDGVSLQDYAPSSANGEPMRDEDLERFQFAAIEEIGKVALDHSFLAGRIGSSYQLPPTLLALLAQLPFPLVAASQSAPAKNSGSVSPQEAPATTPATTETTPTNSGDGSDSRTAATAAAT